MKRTGSQEAWEGRERVGRSSENKVAVDERIREKIKVCTDLGRQLPNGGLVPLLQNRSVWQVGAHTGKKPPIHSPQLED